MHTAFIWCGSNPDGRICAGRKSDLPPLQPWQVAVKIQFRWEAVWCIFDGGCILTKFGKIRIATVHNDFGALVGISDPYQATPNSPRDRSFVNAIRERYGDGMIDYNGKETGGPLPEDQQRPN